VKNERSEIEQMLHLCPMGESVHRKRITISTTDYIRGLLLYR